MFGILFLYLSTSLGSFSPHRFFLNHRLDDIQWASFIPDLQVKLNINSKKIPGLQLVLLVAFEVVDEPLASCMMVYFWICWENNQNMLLKRYIPKQANYFCYHSVIIVKWSYDFHPCYKFLMTFAYLNISISWEEALVRNQYRIHCVYTNIWRKCLDQHQMNASEKQRVLSFRCRIHLRWNQGLVQYKDAI